MEFKRLSDVEVVAEPTESANVLIEENGVIKRASKDKICGSEAENWDGIVDAGETTQYGLPTFEHYTPSAGIYDNVSKKMKNNEVPRVLLKWTYTNNGASYVNTIVINNFILHGDEEAVVMSAFVGSTDSSCYCISGMIMNEDYIYSLSAYKIGAYPGIE